MKNLRNAVVENPMMVLFLGACPAMGATATVLGAAGMGAAVLAVMLLSGIVMAALKKAVPASGRIPVYVITIAGCVSLIQMLMNAFLPNVYQMLGFLMLTPIVILTFPLTLIPNLYFWSGCIGQEYLWWAFPATGILVLLITFVITEIYLCPFSFT